MALEHYSPDHAANDRSQQIIGLLSELSERLKRAEGERDLVRREMMTVRECIQDLNTQSDQAQKAILAFENKFDSTETSVEIALRRLTNMEESVDKQSTELLAILRKIEERFDAYDREYKTHAASITHYADTLDRFDKKLEKLLADKTRLARKIDTLEFQMADVDERLYPANQAGIPGRSTYTPRAYEDDAPSAPAVSADLPEHRFSAPVAANDSPVVYGKDSSASTSTPTESRVDWNGTSASGFNAGRMWQYGAVAVLALLIGTFGFGVTSTYLKQDTPQSSAQTVATTGPSSPAPLTTPPETASTAIPVGQHFSKTIRAQIDAQIVAARKLEDEDTAKLMTARDTRPLATRIKPDSTLPRAIKGIEAKAFDGSAEAQHDMGALYTSGGSGVTVNYSRGAQWFTESAQNGIANARYNLGVLSQQGLGTEKNLANAMAWYRSAALLEHPEARYNLGIAYVEGIGVTYNPAMAAGYFEQAARAGVVEAAYNLGLILENGLIEEPRPYEGLFWYKLAMDGGSQDGTRSFARLSANLGIEPESWQTLYTAMLSERPDLKQLADSRGARALSLQTPDSKVRVHNMDKSAPATGNATTRLTAPRLAPPPAPKTLAASIVDDQVASTITPKIVTPDVQDDPEIQRQMTARIQTMLSDEGLYKGKPDGLMGPGTARAIRAYQAKYNLAVDGQPSTTLMAQMLAKRLADQVEPAAKAE